MQTAKNRSKKNPLVSTLIAALVFVLAGEAFCRVLDSYDAWKHHQDLLSRKVIYRDQTYTVGKPEGVRRVLLLGGSAVYDTVKDHRESWPYLLEQKLRKKTGKNVEVINLAFYSECSVDEVFKLNEFGLELEPDAVVVFDGENDVYNFFHHFDYWKRLYELKARNILHQKKHDPFTRFFGNLRKNSSLYQRLNQLKKSARTWVSVQAMDEQRSKKAAEPQAPAQPAAAVDPMAGVGAGPQGEKFFEDRSRWPEIQRESLAIYRANLDKMARLIKKAGARGLFIFQPDLSYKAVTGQVSEAERSEYLKVIGRHEAEWKEIQQLTYPPAIDAMKSVADANGIPFYDFNPEFLSKGDAAGLFEGNVHFSPAGREAVAEYLAGLIEI